MGALSLTTIASELAPTGAAVVVEASLLAMSRRALRGVRLGALSLATIASRLAPTGTAVVVGLTVFHDNL